MSPVASPQTAGSPSFLKSITLATATVALSMWGLGTLWLNAEASANAAASDATVAEVLGSPALR